MRAPPPPFPFAAFALLALGFAAWRTQLVRVDDSIRARPLALVAADEREAVRCDVVLPAVPVGMTHVRSGGSPLLIHYWAPWERHGRAQAAALDSLDRLLSGSDLRVVLVASDPFPSVARFVARQRLRLHVLLDGPGLLRAQVDCPRLPHTVLIGRDGRAAVLQSGEVDWLAPETRATLDLILAEPGSRGPGETAPPPGPSPRHAP